MDKIIGFTMTAYLLIMALFLFAGLVYECIKDYKEEKRRKRKLLEHIGYDKQVLQAAAEAMDFIELSKEKMIPAATSKPIRFRVFKMGDSDGIR